MPPKKQGSPKSGRKSGKLSKAEKERLKKEEAERKLREEEEARLREEQEKREREERERLEREEKERLEAEERARHQAEVDALTSVLERNSSKIRELLTQKREKAKWDRYMLCDGTPDPTIPNEINTFMNFWRDDGGYKPMADVLQECEDVVQLIDELQNLIAIADIEGLREQDIERHKESINKLQELIFYKIDQATMQLLQNAEGNLDPDTLNIQTTTESKNITVSVWGNTAQNPRVKSFAFEKNSLSMELPKLLAQGSIAVRMLFTDYDHMSHKCRSFYPRRKIIEPVEPEAVPEEEVTEETKPAEVEGVVGETEDLLPVEEVTKEPPSRTTSRAARVKSSSSRRSAKSTKSTKSTKSQASEPPKEEEKETKDSEEGGTEGEGGEENADVTAIETEAPIVDAEDEYDEDFDDEEVIDLRSFTNHDRVIYIDLVELPPQPKQVKGWIIQQIVSSQLNRLPYSSEIQRSPGETQTTDGTPVPENAQQPATNPPVIVSFMLPKDIMFHEQPQLARWEESKNHWRLDGITDTTYDEENKVISFKTCNFGPYAVFQDLYLNMPFQSWEIRPLGIDHCCITMIAAVVELEIQIKGSLCCLTKPDDAEEVVHLRGKWMPSKQLMKNLQIAGINVFPAEDGNKYVSIQTKDEKLEQSLYKQMALTASGFSYSWSRWNADCGKDKVIMQGIEHLSDEPVNEDDYQLYMFGTHNSCKLKISEFDETFSEDIAENTQLHSDLYHMVQDGASEECLRRIKESDFLFVDCVHHFLSATRLITYS